MVVVVVLVGGLRQSDAVQVAVRATSLSLSLLPSTTLGRSCFMCQRLRAVRRSHSTFKSLINEFRKILLFYALF